MSKTLLKFAIALKKKSHNHRLPGRLISENTKKNTPEPLAGRTYIFCTKNYPYNELDSVY